MNTPNHSEDLLAGQPIDAADERALALVRTHLSTTDPVPSGLTERVKFAMTVASLEAEVAHLISEGSLATNVRTTEYDRATTVTFESDGLSIMVSLEEADRGVTTLRGWVTAPAAEIELRERTRTSTTTADDDGRFVFEGVERGTVHLVIRQSDQPHTRPVITPGIEI
ncbi:hypothetical protein N802_02860 [Knoellia sinensis KCTC 19936]|uniref:Carboxypeptidase regulatory-like domain-containing protein n=1 Tax=Knoellia sinensis KCTC 19936 TaxID=1385520 RepID=A0A0A0J4Q2_9MICO|nr:hypothetical protein [Knoellia sinensis]KGN31724.1 hypothetical protein N802_02860 [Knoellia sinensis KCTC 19936]